VGVLLHAAGLHGSGGGAGFGHLDFAGICLILKVHCIFMGFEAHLCYSFLSTWVSTDSWTLLVFVVIYIRVVKFLHIHRVFTALSIIICNVLLFVLSVKNCVNHSLLFVSICMVFKQLTFVMFITKFIGFDEIFHIHWYMHGLITRIRNWLLFALFLQKPPQQHTFHP